MVSKTFYTVFKTTAGWVAVLGSAAGLKRTTLPQPSRLQALASLGDSLKEAGLAPNVFKDVIKRFRLYFSGRRTAFPDKLDLSEATDFQRRVWEAARRIPYGETGSYAFIALQIGKPKAARAVGQALGRNPLPIIIPCHRVLRSDGGLGGFSGGLAMKRRLLTLEKQRSGIQVTRSSV